MKKIGKSKKIGLAVTSVFACTALLSTGIAAATPYNAAAEGATATPTEIELFDGITVQDKCSYGGTITVPDASGKTVKVTAPNGTDVALGTATDSKYTVTANQVGNYTVTYSDEASGAKYDFNVYVTLEEDYFLKVDYNGAGIPTYIKNGDKFTLPDASVVYYDENNVLRSYGSVTPTITDSLGGTYSVGDEVTASQNGKLYITYAVAVGTNGQKYLSETFTVNVQSSFTDTAAPSLAVSGISSEYSVNRPVTLPTATVSDSFDDNVKVTITVLDPDGEKVRLTDIDRCGYSYQTQAKLDEDETAGEANEKDWNYPYVKFDNDKAMTFYPVKEGPYTITYVAEDDAGNTSVTKSFRPEVKDSYAPQFEEIAEYQIPTTWGLNVSNKAGVQANLSGKITMPIPVLVDNKDHMYADPAVENDDALISLYFRVTDADYSRNIVEFKNILSSGDDSKYTSKADSASGSIYGTEGTQYTFNKDNTFTFDFALYDRKDAKGDTVDKTGTYTVYYRAEDKAGNRSTKSFTVTLENDYTDDAAPSTAEVTVPAYISAADEYLNIPTPAVSDGKDKNPKVEYKLYTDNEEADEEGGKFITVKGGERAGLVEDDGLVLVIDKDKDYEKSLKLGKNLYFCVTATDSVGNVKSNSTDTSVTAFDADNCDTCEAVVKVIAPEAASQTYEYKGDNIKLQTFKYNKDREPIDLTEVSDSNKIYADSNVNAGGFEISVSDADMRKYTGFEVSVTDSKGNEQVVTLETFTTFDETSATIFVNNITFVPGAAGKHYLTVRVFDVNNKNSVYSYEFDVEKATSSSGSTKQATVISGSGSAFVKYTLHNEKIENIGSSDKTYYVARKISGGRFSLMGSELIAKTQGAYSITDGYIEESKAIATATFDNDVTPYGANNGKYTVDIKDTGAPVIDIQGVMPTYGKKSTTENPATVELPAIVAYAENGTAKVDVTVKDSSGSKVTVNKDDATGKYSFVATKDGVYTVTVTATRAAATPVVSTYSINVGDVEGPEFSVSAPSGRMKVGDSFNFSTMTLATGENENGVTITKRLIDPSKEEVSSATVSGTYKSYYNKNGSDITLDKSGTYEVVYTATDSVGNVTTQRFTINVAASGSSTPTTFTTLSTVLIVVAVVLLAGVIVYVVRFRKVKK